VRVAVRAHQSVLAEVVVVADARLVFPPAAIGEEALHAGTGSVLGRNRLPDSLVYPVPHETTDGVDARVEDVPVLLQIAVAVAHGMRVLDEQQGHVRLALSVVERRLRGRIHPGVEVRIQAAAADGALVVEWS
jgi:hypothetical protein